MKLTQINISKRTKINIWLGITQQEHILYSEWGDGDSWNYERNNNFEVIKGTMNNKEFLNEF